MILFFKKIFIILCLTLISVSDYCFAANSSSYKDYQHDKKQYYSKKNENKKYNQRKYNKYNKQNKNSKHCIERKNCKQYKHFGIIISGPSGVGKTTIIEELVKKHPELIVSVSATTREKRNGEVEGKSYYFVNKKDFHKMKNNDEFIEYAKNYGNYYGSPKKNYTQAIKNKKDVIFALSVEGTKNAIKNKNMDFVTIFITVPSDETLLQRLKNRGTENEKQLKKRFNSAKHEMSFAQNYDYVVYNDNLNNAVKNIEAIYLAEKWKRLNKSCND